MNEEQNDNGRKKVGLALGGGAARGLAHIGVIMTLEQAGVPIDFIAGTSMGSMIGSAYAAGMECKRLHEVAVEAGWRHIARPTWPRHGLLSFERLETWMINLIGDVDIRDLSIPFAAVATDLETGERVILREGRLSTTVRASCSVPGFVAPIEVNGRLLCDGGVSDNVPDDAARMLGADYVIGVDIFAPAYRTYLGPVGVALAAVETLVRHAGGGNANADCLIVPDMVGQSYLRLSNYEAFIEAGAQATRDMLPVILDDLAASPQSPASNQSLETKSPREEPYPVVEMG